MSDGPHRSLPLRRHWRDFAERSAKAAFPSAEVCEALAHALKKDILEAPIEEVREIMGGDTLFPQMRIEQLEALRQSHHGAAAAHLIDSAIEAAGGGLQGEPATEAALQNGLEGIRRDALRGIEEHYQRKADSRSAGFVRTRMDAVRRQHDCGALAREILSTEKPPSRRLVSLPRRSGVDEGPPLCRPPRISQKSARERST
jgi:hypothetical protein